MNISMKNRNSSRKTVIPEGHKKTLHTHIIIQEIGAHKFNFEGRNAPLEAPQWSQL